MSTSKPLLLDMRQTADYIGTSYGSVRLWTYGQRPAPVGWPSSVKFGGRVRYRASDLDDFVAHLGAAPAPPPPPAPAEPRRPRGRPRKLAPTPAAAGGEGGAA